MVSVTGASILSNAGEADSPDVCGTIIVLASGASPGRRERMELAIHGIFKNGKLMP
jgi:hypothetical protein